MSMLTARQHTPELMDDPNVDRADLEASLRFIRMVNRRLGGVAATLNHLKRWAATWSADRTIRILDVGTGSADIPLAIANWASTSQHRVHITAIDLHETTLSVAREQVGNRSDIELVQADARNLMDIFEPRTFEYAHAGMFLHHLSDIEVMTVLRIMDRLTTRGMIWNDLVRGPIETLAVRLLTLRAPAMVKHDGVISVAAGFTRREVLEVAKRVGLEKPKYHRHVFGRFTLVSEKAQLEGEMR